MCLGIPAKIVKINDSVVEVEIGGVIKEASCDLIDEPRIGDYVILHAGFAIQKLSEEDAQETLQMIREMGL